MDDESSSADSILVTGTRRASGYTGFVGPQARAAHIAESVSVIVVLRT